MANLGTLTLDLIAKTGNFVSELSRAERASRAFAETTKRNAKIAAGAFVALGTATAAAAAAMVNTYRQVIDENAKTARALETTYSAYVTLKEAAGEAGVGMSTVESASRTLNRELGKALSGSEKQTEAFRRLKLSAEEVAKLPLDERITTINQALVDNIDVNQRAAAAAELFGSRNGAAMQLLNADGIASAAEQLDLFGLRLSEVDAVKVESANDALARFGLLAEGVGTQLTVELAPVLQAIADLFMDGAREAGGMGNAVQTGVDKAVHALAFMADAADGVKRVFTLAADAVILVLNDIAATAARVAWETLNALNKIPGVDYSQELKAVGDFGRQANAVVKEAAANMQRTLDEPLAGQKLLEFYRKAQEEGEKAAAAAVADLAARRAQGQVYEKTAGSVGKLAKAAKTARDANEELIKSLQLEAATLGMSKRERELYVAAQKGATASQLEQIRTLHQTIDAYEKTEKAAAAYKAVVETLRTDEERRTETLREQLKAIRESAAAQDEQAKMAARAAKAATGTDKPEFGGGDSPMGELLRFDKQETELQNWYDKQLEMLAEFREQFAEQSAEWDAAELEAKRHFNEQMAQIDKARTDTMLTSAEQMFGAAAGLAKQFLGENSRIYKALFAMEKAAAIARAGIAIFEGIALAAANPWPTNLAAMASVAAATAGLVSNIAAIGMAHDGIDSVPKTGTWILEKGERVMTEKTSAKLDRTLDDVRNQKGAGGGVVVNLNEDASRAGQVNQSTGTDEQTIIDIFVRNLMSDGRAADAFQTKYGVQTQGR